MSKQTKVERDETTGELVLRGENERAEPTGEGFALWMDEGDDKPTSTTRYGGVVWNIREMRGDEIDAYEDYSVAQLAAHLGLELGDVADNEKFKVALKTVPQGGEKWMKWLAQGYENICLAHIKGWSAQRAFSADAVRALAPSAKAKLAGAIIQKSTLGNSNDDFLELS